MAVRCLFFAQSADWMKTKTLDIEVDGPTPLLAALARLPAFYPVIERRSCLKVAVNRVIADYSTEVRDGDEVAFLPPYSGG